MLNQQQNASFMYGEHTPVNRASPQRHLMPGQLANEMEDDGGFSM